MTKEKHNNSFAVIISFVKILSGVGLVYLVYETKITRQF